MQRALGFCMLLAALAVPSMAQAKETLIWLLRDLPPLTIFEGPQQNQGAIDQLLPLLIASMPEYEHSIVRVNRARGLQMLREPSFTCDPALLWSSERAKQIVFSIPAFRIISNGLAVRDQDQPALAPFIADGQVDLAALLASRSKKLGIVAERSYGKTIDKMLTVAPGNTITAHYGNEALSSLMQMQRLGRISALLGYWPEIRYQAQLQGIPANELIFYPIKGIERYQSGYIGCSDTAQGRQAITQINQALRPLRDSRLMTLYSHWLDPASRDDYMMDARAFFQSPAAQ